MENEALGFSEQEYREMDRGALAMWLARIEAEEDDKRCEEGERALLALERLGGLMGAW